MTSYDAREGSNIRSTTSCGKLNRCAHGFGVEIAQNQAGAPDVAGLRSSCVSVRRLSQLPTATSAVDDVLSHTTSERCGCPQVNTSGAGSPYHWSQARDRPDDNARAQVNDGR